MPPAAAIIDREAERDELVGASIKPGTRKAYESKLKKFNDFYAIPTL